MIILRYYFYYNIIIIRLWEERSRNAQNACLVVTFVGVSRTA